MNLLQTLQSKQSNHSSNVDTSRLGEGSVVRVKGGFGSESASTVTLVGVEYDGKNGRDTIDYLDEDGDGRWAYTDQIVNVITY
jgi:hypothetical protein